MTSDVESVMKEGGRRRELQDPLNRMLYHPAAKRLAAQLARTRITPNMVSVAGGLIVVAAAAAYAMPYWPLSALLGLALQGLTLIPVSYQVEIPRYVVLAPSPKPPLEGESFLPAWELSYIVPEGFI